jgi:hypothetical protein
MNIRFGRLDLSKQKIFKFFLQDYLQYLLLFSLVFLFQFYFGGAGINQFGFIDPNLYTGLAINYDLNNFLYNSGYSGQASYASSRIVHISILNLAFNIFGVKAVPIFLSTMTAFSAMALVFLTKKIFSEKNLIFLIYVSFLCFLPSFNYDSRWTDESITGSCFTVWAVVFTIVALTKIYNKNSDNTNRYALLSGIMISLSLSTQLKYFIFFVAYLLVLILMILKKIIKFRILLLQTLGLIATFIAIEIYHTFLVGEFSGFVIIEQFKFLLGINSLGQGNGEWTYKSLQSLISLKYTYIYSLLILLIIPITAKRRLSTTYKMLISLIATFYISVLSFQFILKFPLLDTFWYYGTLWPLVGIIYIFSFKSIEKSNVTKLIKKNYLLLIYPFFIFLYISNIYLQLVKIDVAKTIFILILITWFTFLELKSSEIAFGYLVILISIYMQFTQPPSGSFNFQNMPVKGYQFVVEDITSDQFFLIKNYEKYFTDEVIPIWYGRDTSGYLGSVQSSLGFGFSRLHGLGEDGDEPNFSNWDNSYPRPSIIMLIDLAQGIYLENAKNLVKKEGYQVIEQNKSITGKVIVVTLGKASIT